MKPYQLQAHRGVSTENPENTMSAFLSAVRQGYDWIEVDPAVTADKKIVTLHDKTINRTARYPDGGILPEEKLVGDMTYDQLMQLDFGLSFSPKFRGEKLPLLSQLLALAEEAGIGVKLDNKIFQFSPEERKILFQEIRRFHAKVAFTCPTVEAAADVSLLFPESEIHFDGAVDKPTLPSLSRIVPRERLTVWLPYRCAGTSWVKVPFATPELAALVKQYGKLGIWILNDVDQLHEAVETLQADIVETAGELKPLGSVGTIPDTHMHSCHSHDARDSVEEMYLSAQEKKLDVLCITDHCDIEFCDSVDVVGNAITAVKDIRSCARAFGHSPKLLAGIEMGEMIWNGEASQKVLSAADYDVVIGSVHAVRYEGYTQPYAGIDFSQMSHSDLEGFLSAYFDDLEVLLKTGDFDVLAHLTCPFRYINGKYRLGIDTRRYEEPITKILRTLIQRGTALEVNTSTLGGFYDELMPEEWILAKYREMGGYLITAGSDAHVKENVGHGFKDLFTVLKRNRFEYLFYYENRMPVACRLI